jgi:hypothetical protein
LLAFYDFPAEHWKHVRTSNPIESTFATVRLRTDKTKGCLSRQTALAMVFRLAKTAERQWRRHQGGPEDQPFVPACSRDERRGRGLLGIEDGDALPVRWGRRGGVGE